MKTQEELLQALGDGPKNEWDVSSIDWDLNESSVVVEIGGYCGRWAKAIWDLYAPNLYVFEPQKWAYDICIDKFKTKTDVGIFNYALGLHDTFMVMGEFGRDGASLLRTNDPDQIVVEVRDANVILGIIGNIDLMLINIEGYEYTLIPYLAECGILQRVKNLMVQFHPGYVDPEVHDSVIDRIRETHKYLWNYGSVLMAWSLK